MKNQSPRVKQFIRHVLFLLTLVCSGCGVVDSTTHWAFGSASMSSAGSPLTSSGDYPDYLKDRAKLLGANPREILNLAAFIPQNMDLEDMRRVSSVYHNRLRQGLSFEFSKEMEERTNDKKFVAPIICVPAYDNRRGVVKLSRESVEAALDPVASSYLYYCKDVSGRLTFFKTYSEFEQFVSLPEKRGPA